MNALEQARQVHAEMETFRHHGALVHQVSDATMASWIAALDRIAKVEEAPEELVQEVAATIARHAGDFEPWYSEDCARSVVAHVAEKIAREMERQASGFMSSDPWTEEEMAGLALAADHIRRTYTSEE